MKTMKGCNRKVAVFFVDKIFGIWYAETEVIV